MDVATSVVMQDLYPSRYSDRPLTLPRRDPVVYAPSDAEPPIEPGLVEQYRRDGVAVLPDMLGADEVRRLKKEADRLRQLRVDLEEGTVITEPGQHSAEAVRSIFAIHRQSSAFRSLAADRRLTALARYLLDDDVYIHQSRLNCKPAFRGKEFFWHSDFETWHVEDGMPRMRALSISVMLTDNHPFSGPTMFVPGSHLAFLQCVGETPRDHYKTSLKKQEFGVPDPDVLARLVKKGGLMAPSPRAGSVVVFDCNILHGSSGNITPFERVNAFYVFNAWSNRLVAPFGRTEPRPEFIAHRRSLERLPQDRVTRHHAA